MSSDFSHLQTELLGTFFEEAFESLDRLESGLLQLDERRDPALVNEVFRAAHSVKGGAGTFGFGDVTDIAHQMESLLDGVRTGRRAPTAPLCALLLEAVDVLKRLLTAKRDHKAFAMDAALSLLERLATAAAAPADETKPVPITSPAERSSTETAPATDPDAPSGGARLTFRPHAHLLRTGNEPLRLLRELRKLGAERILVETSGLPSFRELCPLDCHLSWTADLPPEVARADVDDVFSWVEGDCELTYAPLGPTLSSAAMTADAPNATAGSSGEVLADGPPEHSAPASSSGSLPVVVPPAGARSPTGRADIDTQMSSVRVGIDKIDFLMNMVGELVITQSMLGELEDDKPLSPARLLRLREGLSQLARHTRTLQEGVLRLRSLPISSVFHRFPRLVHDLGATLGKKVQLRVEGEATELDKTVLEKLGEPLVHLVRNSLDHGLEDPASRAAAGKPETGTLTLRAWNRGSDVMIEVSDDGRGLDLAKIRSRAIARGLMREGEPLSDAALADLVFAPGFSTAETVTDVSGRGVGMDVVRQNVRALGGDAALTFEPGRGTRVTLRLPVTLAIVEGQLVRVAEHTYVVPLLPIIESMPLDTTKVRRVVGHGRVYLWRQTLVPAIDLGTLLLGRPRPETDAGRQLMVVETDQGPVGLIVDELLGQQQIVVKSLERNFERVPGFAGATILGDGAVALILDVAGLAASGAGRRLSLQGGEVSGGKSLAA